MPVAAAIVGSAVIGGVSSTIAGNKAAKAQTKAAAQSDATQRYFYDTNRQDMAPYREVGTGALYKLADMYGVPRSLPAPTNTNAPPAAIPGLSGYGIGGGFRGRTIDMTQGADGVYSADQPQQMTPGYDGFQESPGYQFRLGEGVKAAERSAAARGLLGSGATMKAIQRYGEGLASSEYENYANRLAALAGIGQTSTAQTGAAGMSAANQISASQQAAGNARASAYANTGAQVSNGINNALYGYLRFGQGGGGGGAYGIAGSDGIY